MSSSPGHICPWFGEGSTSQLPPQRALSDSSPAALDATLLGGTGWISRGWGGRDRGPVQRSGDSEGWERAGAGCPAGLQGARRQPRAGRQALAWRRPWHPAPQASVRRPGPEATAPEKEPTRFWLAQRGALTCPQSGWPSSSCGLTASSWQRLRWPAGLGLVRIGDGLQLLNRFLAKVAVGFSYPGQRPRPRHIASSGAANWAALVGSNEDTQTQGRGLAAWRLVPCSPSRSLCLGRSGHSGHRGPLGPWHAFAQRSPIRVVFNTLARLGLKHTVGKAETQCRQCDTPTYGTPKLGLLGKEGRGGTTKDMRELWSHGNGVGMVYDTGQVKEAGEKGLTPLLGSCGDGQKGLRRDRSLETGPSLGPTPGLVLRGSCAPPLPRNPSFSGTVRGIVRLCWTLFVERTRSVL
ncbi:hypothetical protein Cadr_000024066 [Camelus dromedarius]|uniref:Uncharacterized protein n=1 Tax=Camelus dromedarius TaxID=9838 RepID=A0A5N4CX81_CAMDR|nr:hypothetical protein Cadr_000024066 [Camelus dromedarius]